MTTPNVSENRKSLLMKDYDLLFDLLPDPILVLDGDRRLIRANQVLRRELHLPDDYLTVPADRLFASFPVLFSLVTDAVAPAQVVVTDPHQRVWQVTITPCDQEGGTSGILVTLHDIAPYHRFTDELREYEERWKGLERAGVAMVYKNHETGMVHFSIGSKHLLGYADDELDTWLTVDAWHAMLHPDELDQILASFQADSREQVTFSHLIHRLRCKDGSYKWVHVRGAVVRRDADGRPLRGAGVLTDLSCLREACQVSGLWFDRQGETADASFDIWTLQESALQLKAPNGATLRLNAKEYQFFSMMADAVPQILPRIDAVTGIYARYDESSAHSFDVIISRLRKKIETCTGAPFPLQTLYSLGYLFAAHLKKR